MAGSDLPSGGSGATSPQPRTPPTKPAKRKRGGDSAGPPSLPSRATRSSAPARKAAVGPLRMVRRAAAGALWTEKTGSGRSRGRGFGDVERMREVILGVRLARSVRIPDDDPDSPYPKEIRRSGSRSSERVNCKISYLSCYPEKRAGTEPDMQASIPEWKNKPSDEETDDYKAASLTALGTIVCPLNMDISATDEAEKTRKVWVDNCVCSHPGSEDCVRVHVEKARSSIKDQLGEVAFKNCGLDAMGEQVGELWAAVDKKKLEDVDKLIPQNKHQRFVKIALMELGQKETKDLATYQNERKVANYYYNVFLPRRLASLTRAEDKKDEAIDTDGEKSSQDDDNNEHLPRKKSGSSESSSSTRCKKSKSRKNWMS